MVIYRKRGNHAKIATLKNRKPHNRVKTLDVGKATVL